ncbi:MAG: hypothetical protein ACE5OS_12545 [Anaerolineae bacterium]
MADRSAQDDTRDAIGHNVQNLVIFIARLVLDSTLSRSSAQVSTLAPLDVAQVGAVAAV